MNRYDEYKFTGKEWVWQILAGTSIVWGILFVFYRSFLICILGGIPLVWFYIRRKKHQKIQDRRWQLNLEFKDGMQSVSAALQAGYAIENSFREAVNDMKMLYGEESLIVREFTYIIAQLQMNRTVEEVLAEFGERSGVEDISQFAGDVLVAKRTGGNLVEVIRSTVHNISDKVEVKREIQTMVAAKQLESRVMNIIPIGMIVYMWIGSPGFLEPMYTTAMGRIVMSAGLAIYGLAFYIGERILNIPV